MEVAKEVIGSNEFAVALRTSNAKDFGLTLDYPYVEKVIALMDNDNLVERERGLDLIIWHFLDEAVTFDYFSLERSHQLYASSDDRRTVEQDEFRVRAEGVYGNGRPFPGKVFSLKNNLNNLR